MVLRWSGRDGGATLVSLEEATTAVRVRVECGLLTEAFMYQRTICGEVKDKKLKDAYDEIKEQYSNWLEVLVTEICYLCIRRNLVDRMIELPWNADEEKHIHKCLLDFATDDPSKAVGSLLVVFYLQVLLVYLTVAFHSLLYLILVLRHAADYLDWKLVLQ